MKKNIILIGMMGSGKTTIGAALSEKLSDFQYIDIDNEIEKGTQKKISEIFLQHGEPYFRMLETDKIKKFCTGEKRIISAGGGAFENEENRKIMLNNGNVIYLKASPEEIYNRIKNEVHRPLLKKNFSIEKIEFIMKNREKNYKKAHFTINTTAKTPQVIVEEILGVIND
ncbi:shikimate kinase [Clostridium sp. CAG:967]|nr:shikimate kinase [Clostridium sp. CAG:967]